MTVVSWVGFVLGIMVVLSTLMSVVSALVLPRLGSSRIAKWTGRTVIRVFSMIANKFVTYEPRDRVLALQAPFYLVALLAVWLSALLVGFALLLWPFMSSGGFVHALTVSGSSLLTLGFATEAGAAPRLLVFVAAAAGLTIVALEIAYLPVLYGAFNRREVLVTLLDSRAGSPAWGPEILARHELVDNVHNLPSLYARWEEWAADVAETHTSYPVLIWFRSPHPQRSWVLGLLAVMDAAALQLATQPLSSPSEARAMLRMGYVALREVGRIIGLPVNDDPRPDDPVELSEDSFRDAVHHLEHAGWPMERTIDEAWVHFRGWRVNYEPLAYAMADTLNAPPALWSGQRHNLPAHLQPPERPPHRTPSLEVRHIKEVTRQRRAIRDGSAVSVRRPSDTDSSWGPMT